MRSWTTRSGDRGVHDLGSVYLASVMDSVMDSASDHVLDLVNDLVS